MFVGGYELASMGINGFDNWFDDHKSHFYNAFYKELSIKNILESNKKIQDLSKNINLLYNQQYLKKINNKEIEKTFLKLFWIFKNDKADNKLFEKITTFFIYYEKNAVNINFLIESEKYIFELYNKFLKESNIKEEFLLKFENDIKKNKNNISLFLKISRLQDYYLKLNSEVEFFQNEVLPKIIEFIEKNLNEFKEKIKNYEEKNKLIDTNEKIIYENNHFKDIFDKIINRSAYELEDEILYKKINMKVNRNNRVIITNNSNHNNNEILNPPINKEKKFFENHFRYNYQNALLDLHTVAAFTAMGLSIMKNYNSYKNKLIKNGINSKEINFKNFLKEKLLNTKNYFKKKFFK